MQRWWERYPGRLDDELARLTLAGISHRIDPSARSAEDRIVIHADVRVAGTLVSVTCVFPDTYPFFRPEIFADGLRLSRHQHPTEKNLCLLPQVDLEHAMPWSVHDTLAKLLVEQLPKIFGEGGTPSAPTLDRPHDEVDQGEPYAEYFPTGDSLILLDGSARVPANVMRGRLELAIRARYGEDTHELIGAILQVKDDQSRVVTEAGARLSRWARSMRRLSIPWARVASGSALLAALEESHRTPKSEFSWQRVDGKILWISAVLFNEEVGHGTTADGWFFKMTRKLPPTCKTGRATLAVWRVRGGRAGEDELFERIPELRFMRSCKIGIVGLGGIGAPSALEFARAGADELRLLDGDYVDPGTAVRWPLGFSDAGLVKPRALAEVIAADYPYTSVAKYVHRIGVAPRKLNDAPREGTVLAEFFDELDLIYDASGDMAVEDFLCTRARELGIPLVRVSTTNGAWGGVCARFLPGPDAPCSHCLLHAWNEASVPGPAAAPDKGIQPQGCRSRTFTGAGVDVAEVALNGVRLALSTLSRLKGGLYPDAPGDVLVMNYRHRETGALVWPGESKWLSLPKHQACEQHSS